MIWTVWIASTGGMDPGLPKPSDLVAIRESWTLRDLVLALEYLELRKVVEKTRPRGKR